MAQRNEFLDEELLDEEEDEEILKDKYLAFRLGDEDYALDIACVTEIIGMQPINRVPDMPGYIKGVINIRGRVVPVMDVRLRVRMDERAYDTRTCIIVILLNGNNLGLIVDRVSEVVYMPEEDIEARPTISMKVRDQFIRGMGKVNGQVKMIMDVNRLLHQRDLSILEQAVKTSL